MTQTETTTADTNFDRRDPRARPIAPNDDARKLMTDSIADVQRVIDAQAALLASWKDVQEALAKSDWTDACLAVLACDEMRQKMLAEGTALVHLMARMQSTHKVLHEHAVYCVEEVRLRQWCDQVGADEVRHAIETHDQTCTDEDNECDMGVMLRENLARLEPQ